MIALVRRTPERVFRERGEASPCDMDVKGVTNVSEVEPHRVSQCRWRQPPAAAAASRSLKSKIAMQRGSRITQEREREGEVVDLTGNGRSKEAGNQLTIKPCAAGTQPSQRPHGIWAGMLHCTYAAPTSTRVRDINPFHLFFQGDGFRIRGE